MDNRSVRILVEPSDYVLRNVGDMAMLHVAIDRLAKLWPGATIKVLTDEPEALAELCPSAMPLLSDGRTQWLGQDFLPDRLQRRLSEHWPRRVREHAPGLVTMLWRRKLRGNDRLLSRLGSFTSSVDEADLVLVTGMGGITDAFPKYAHDVLETLNLALRGNRRVAMVGQGFGPLQDPDLRSRAAAILPRLDLIALREKHVSAPLLEALGVPRDRIVATGDDAIEMAYGVRQPDLGPGIGVNLRVSGYSGVAAGLVAELGQLFAEIADACRAPLIPIPVSRVPGEADLDTIRGLMPDDREELDRATNLRTPIDLIRQIQRCRVVVTGSYHGGVFALANGIPTIGLAKSAYYVNKFEGLADMFGMGCSVVNLEDEDHLLQLRTALERLWNAAPDIRSGLLESAETQIAAGHSAYQKIYQSVAALR